MPRGGNWYTNITKIEAQTRYILYVHRLANGESMADIARADGISRQAVHIVLKNGKAKGYDDN